MTTFARIAKIIMGAISPRNWIESAFAELANGGDGGGALIVHEGENRVLDKTWKEIKDSGCAVLVLEEPGKDGGVGWTYWHLLVASYAPASGQDPAGYVVNFGTYSYETDSENGYPHHPLVP